MIVHPEGYLRGLRELTPDARHAPDRRRGRRRLRPDRDALRLRAGRGHARLPLPGQGAHRRLPAAGRDPDDRGGLLRLLRHAPPRARPSITATPTAGTRSARRSRLATLAGLRRRADARRRCGPKIARLAERLAEFGRAAARRRRPPARADRGHRAGRRQGDEDPVRPGPSRSAPRLPPGARLRPADPAAGRRPRHHAAAGDHASSNSTRCSTSCYDASRSVTEADGAGSIG